MESEDDELAFAYFAANTAPGTPYDRKTYTTAYMARAYPLYRPDHLERMVAMVFRACGIKLSTFWRNIVKHIAQRLMRAKVKRAIAQDQSGWKLIPSPTKA